MRKRALCAAALVPGVIASTAAVSVADTYGNVGTSQNMTRGVRQTLRVTYNTQSCNGTTLYKITQIEGSWERLQSTSRIREGRLNAANIGFNCSGSYIVDDFMNRSFTPSFDKSYVENPTWGYRNCTVLCGVSRESPGGATAANLSVRAADLHGESQLCSTWAITGSTGCP